MRSIVAAGLAALLWAAPAPCIGETSDAETSGAAVDEREIATAQAVLEKNEPMLMKIPGVVGVGIGITEAGDHAAIHVFVDTKGNADRVSPGIPQEIDHVPVRIIAGGPIRAR